MKMSELGERPLKLEIINAKEIHLSSDDIHMLAEIEVHPEVAKWDILAFEGDVEKAYLAFKRPLRGYLRQRMNFSLQKFREKSLVS